MAHREIQLAADSLQQAASGLEAKWNDAEKG